MIFSNPDLDLTFFVIMQHPDNAHLNNNRYNKYITDTVKFAIGAFLFLVFFGAWITTVGHAAYYVVIV
jgi:hypothetical protein